jgi:hypothetical protein
VPAGAGSKTLDIGKTTNKTQFYNYLKLSSIQPPFFSLSHIIQVSADGST